MTSNEIEIEKFKIQKQQLYLQIASVLLSATLLYAILFRRTHVEDEMKDDNFLNQYGDQ